MKLYSAPHEEYRKSDNEWDGLLPSTWDEQRVKDLFTRLGKLRAEKSDNRENDVC